MEEKKIAYPFQGLTSQQVLESRAKHGMNLMTPPARDPWWKLYLEKFQDPIIRILIIAAVIAMAIGVFHNEYFEGLGIIIAILLATTLAFLNEYKANKEFDILNRVQDDTPVKTFRNGVLELVPKRDLVVGDEILLELGEEIPADGEVLQAISLQINESRLTGESLPVPKAVDPHSVTHKDTAYPANIMLRGTTVSEGQGVMRITAVGDHTEIGKTARAAAEETDDQTPLNIQLEKLSKVIGVVGFSCASILFISLLGRSLIYEHIELSLANWYFIKIAFLSVLIAFVPIWLPIFFDAMELLRKNYHRPKSLEEISLHKWILFFVIGVSLFLLGIWLGNFKGHLSINPQEWLPRQVAMEILQYFMVAVTLIVVAVPEGLAMSVTLSLAYSMRKMIATNVLVRQMHACETIGAATVICTDKTGTLTMNEMRVQNTEFPNITIPFQKDKITPLETLLLEAICVNSSANLGKNEEGQFHYIGNPTEGGILMWLYDQGINYLDYRTPFKTTQQWPFNTERKFMATLGTGRSGKLVLYAKGAPEILLQSCTTSITPTGTQPISDDYKKQVATKLEEYQNRGMRTLGFAYRELPTYNKEDLTAIAHDFIWLGFVAIADELRPEIPDVIKNCRRAGIKVKVVTGDNQNTAREISRKIGLWDAADSNDRYMTGPEFAALSDEQAPQAAANVKILSRARPMDKMRLVSLLKAQDEVVAVTGDGTNDAPALNHANVGLAMGKTGTSVAKEASDIIILDDSFSSVVNAVMWGRSLYQNIQKFVLFQLTINVLALAIVIVGPFIGIKLPLTVTQMLWVNLIMDTFAALALATEPPRSSVMHHPPRSPKAFIITKDMAISIFGTAFVFFALLVAGLVYMKQHASDPSIKAQNETIFFTVFVMLQFWNLFNAKCYGRVESAFSRITENHSFILIMSCILIGQILIVQFGGKFFRTQPLDLMTWLYIIAGTSAVLWIGEIIRVVQRYLERKAGLEA